MSLYEKASFMMLPHGYAQGKIFAVKPMSGLADLTFTRTTESTRFNKSGVLERLPWHLLTQSDAPGALALTNATATLEDALDGNGNMTADTIRETSAGSVHGYIAGSFAKDAIPRDYTLEVWTKADGREWIGLAIAETSAQTNSYRMHYNLTTGILGTGVATGSGYTLISASIVAVGNGYYKCTLKVNSGPHVAVVPIITMQAADNVGSYIGDPTKGIKWWRWMLYEGTTEKPFYAKTTRIDCPVVDYYNSSCPKLAINFGVTNYCLNSNNINTWTKTRCSTTPNAAIGVDGLMSATRVTVTDNTALVRVTPTIAVISSTSTLTFSVYVKKEVSYAMPTFQLALTNGTNFQNKEVFFDAITFQPTGVSSGTATLNAAYSEQLLDSNGNGTGWWRCVISITTPLGASTTWGAHVDIQDTVGANVGDTLLLDKAQVNLGTYAQDYVYTLGASVSRSSDVVTLTSLDSKAIITSNKGTLFFELAALSVDRAGINNNSLQFGDITLRGHNTQGAVYVWTAYCDNSTNGNAVIGTKTQRVKCAIVFNGTSYKVFANGVLIVSVNNRAAAMPTSLTLNGAFGDAHYKSLVICPDVITDQEAINETSL